MLPSERVSSLLHFERKTKPHITQLGAEALPGLRRALRLFLPNAIEPEGSR